MVERECHNRRLITAVIQQGKFAEFDSIKGVESPQDPNHI